MTASINFDPRETSGRSNSINLAEKADTLIRDVDDGTVRYGTVQYSTVQTVSTIKIWEYDIAISAFRKVNVLSGWQIYVRTETTTITARHKTVKYEKFVLNIDRRSLNLRFQVKLRTAAARSLPLSPPAPVVHSRPMNGTAGAARHDNFWDTANLNNTLISPLFTFVYIPLRKYNLTDTILRHPAQAANLFVNTISKTGKLFILFLFFIFLFFNRDRVSLTRFFSLFLYFSHFRLYAVARQLFFDILYFSLPC